MKTFKQFITERMMGHGRSGEHSKHYAHPMHLHLKKGAFHRWLGKSEGEPITAADIQKGLAAGGHAAKMANFARNAKHFHHEEYSLQNENVARDHPYTTAAAVGAPIGAVGGALHGAGSGYSVATQLGFKRSAAKSIIKAGLKAGGVVGAATGAGAAALATYGYKIRNKHPTVGGYLSGGVKGAIGSKIDSYKAKK